MAPQLSQIAQAMRHSSDPVAKGRDILLDEYGKTFGAMDCRVHVMAEFECVRSMVVQTAYELMGGTDGRWLSSGELDEELRDATEASILYRQRCASCFGGDRRLMELVAHASSDPPAFLGSARRFVPGAGYGISVRKRDSLNQDRFLIEGGPSMLAVADGCSGSTFSAVASAETVRRLSHLPRPLGPETLAALSRLSSELGRMLNAPEIVAALGAGGGYTTLTIAMPGRSGTKFYKVGDSMPFLAFQAASGFAVESVSPVSALEHAVGGELDPGCVEAYELGPGTAILTSDGVTNFLDDHLARMRKAMDATGDAVIAAETILRAVLRNNIVLDAADDTTIVIADDGGCG